MTDSTSEKPTIALGSDHAGYGIKSFLKHELLDSGYEVVDCGTDSTDSVDYPDYAGAVCEQILSGAARFGVLVCSTGIGISIAANKVHGIRAALCHTEFTAAMSRRHNNANVMTLGGNVLGDKQSLAILHAFLAEPYSHVERHQRRIDKMDGMDSAR